MSRKAIFVIAVGALLMVLGVMGVNGQDGGQFEQVPIITTATNAVGIGSYVAAEAYAAPAGEDPSAEPVQAIILPYGIYPNMHVETIEDFVQPAPTIEGFTFEWNLVVPDGSAATLTSGNVAIFMADIEGRYELTLTATDANGNSGETTWLVDATTYVGAGWNDGDDNQDQCSDCHEDQAAAWAETGHATFFTRAIDGGAGDHYGPNCITCHTTGFNNHAEAVNGGFDDIAADAGWTFPAELVPGNWDAMVAEFPQVAAMANIQCESCHGPGNLHVNEGSRRDSMIGLGLSYGTCAQCHAEDPYHIFPQQWEMSAHAETNAQAFTYPVGEDRQACVGCHSGVGFIDRAAGLPQEEWRTDYQIITCAVCHDPHDASNPNQLRVFDSVTLPNGFDVTSAGPAATCMSCHNARVNAAASVEGAAQGNNFSLPHYSTAAELMNGTGGYSWGLTLPTSTHGRAIEGACIGCHMGATPGMSDNGTPDDSSDDTPLPGHNTVGQHTFSMTDADGVENVAVCQTCHDAATSFEFEARRDYDGDGAIETNQAEVAGLLEVLTAAVIEQGVEVLDHHPYFNVPEGSSADLYGAVYNIKFARDDASAVHNLRYTVSLLQLSYEKVTGSPVPGATILSPKE